MQGVLLPHELRYLLSWENRPSAVVQALSDATFELQTSDHCRMQINARISQFIDTVAACELLYKQPIPTEYTRRGLRTVYCSSPGP